jgi:hypothetical protein
MRKIFLQSIIMQLCLQTALYYVRQVAGGKQVGIHELEQIFLFSFIIGPLVFVTGILILRSSYTFRSHWANKRKLVVTLSRPAPFSSMQGKHVDFSLLNCSYRFLYIYGVPETHPFKNHKLNLALLGICLDLEYTILVNSHEEVTRTYVDEEGTIIKNPIL